MGDEERLRRLLGGTETAWIVERARSRLSRGRPLRGTLTLADASEAQRTAVGRLLGRTVAVGRSLSVPLEPLDRVLRESGAWPAGLASAIEVLGGPFADPEMHRADQAAWSAVTSDLIDLAVRHPVLADWLENLRARGHLRRVASSAAEARSLVRDLATVIGALPADGEPIARFSARVLQRAHALDAGTALGRLAATAAAALGGAAAARAGATGDAASHDVATTHARPGSAGWRRNAWASVGVVVDDLSSTVLVLGLPGTASSPVATPAGTAGALSQLAADGQPAVLTLRQVVSDDLGAIPKVVHVCENPAVVSAAADLLGSRSVPLVCLQGQPGAAAVTLLRRLCQGGATLRYHGDFDWGGVTIARTLASHVTWVPWRFRAADYLMAVAGGGQIGRGARLSGSSLETPWDPDLAAAMGEHRLGVEEELVLDDLLEDLSEHAGVS